MRIEKIVGVALCSVLVVFTSNGMAEKGGNGGRNSGFSPLSAVVLDSNGEPFASVLSINDGNVPAILAGLHITDPNGVTRNGVLGIFAGALIAPLVDTANSIISPEEVPALYYTDSYCQTQPYIGHDDYSLDVQIAIDPIVVSGDEFWMSTTPQEECASGYGGCFSSIFETSSYKDVKGNCHTRDTIIGNGIEVFLVDSDIYLKYPPNYTIGFQ